LIGEKTVECLTLKVEGGQGEEARVKFNTKFTKGHEWSGRGQWTIDDGRMTGGGRWTAMKGTFPPVVFEGG
jgi:hypothetical protein